MTPRIKICGLSTLATLDAALDAGAAMIGLVFFEQSPRHVTHARAAQLAARARGRAEVVALCVDAQDAFIDAIVTAIKPDWMQFHGSETPARLVEVKQRHGLRVIKAIKSGDSADIASAAGYIDAADMLLYDAKAPQGAALPGGNGASFDWRLLAAAPRAKAMMLSGGLDETNVARAIAIATPDWVDVSSGVESAPGVKDAQRIARFAAAVRGVGKGDGKSSQEMRVRA